VRTTVVVVVMLLMAVVIAIFAGQNPQAVLIQFFGWQLETSLVAVIMGAAAAGGILVGAVSLLRYLQSGFRQRELSSQLRELEQQRDELREENQQLLAEVQQLTDEMTQPTGESSPSEDQSDDERTHMRK